jgi:hypothetical protein
VVRGFGTVGEPIAKKVYPGKFTAYRRFRFTPAPISVLSSRIGEAWNYFAVDGVFASWEHLATFREIQNMTPEMLIRQFGDGTWNPSLTATNYNGFAYKAGENVASCVISVHPAPQANCTCGFWAYNTVRETGTTGSGTSWTALAAVEVWGDVVRGTKGVRAEKMQIVGLQPPEELSRVLELPIVKAWQQLTTDLHVPVYASVAELLEFHPPEDVSDQLPPMVPVNGGEMQYPPSPHPPMPLYPFPGCDGSCMRSVPSVGTSPSWNDYYNRTSSTLSAQTQLYRSPSSW